MIVVFVSELALFICTYGESNTPKKDCLFGCICISWACFCNSVPCCYWLLFRMNSLSSHRHQILNLMKSFGTMRKNFSIFYPSYDLSRRAAAPCFTQMLHHMPTSWRSDFIHLPEILEDEVGTQRSLLSATRRHKNSRIFPSSRHESLRYLFFAKLR